jgi:pimeloyl-ACP methyl ester carboxylesterase
MAQDTIGFLEAVVGGPAHLVGWSGGGIIALIVASRRPDLVEKMVAISANFNNVSAVDPEQVEALRGTPADSPEWAFPRSLYESTSPDGPGHWPVVFEKTKAMVMGDLSIEPKELGQITAPTLVVAADDDIIRLEHSIELCRSIPDAQLAIVPGTSHMLVMEKPDHVTRLILDFLGNEPTPTMMPIRRNHEG